MKKNKLNGSLFILLARYFVLFSIVIFAIALGVYAMWSMYYETQYQIADINGLMNSKGLANGNYEKVKTKSYLGSDGDFAILDKDGKVIYKSGPSIKTDYTQDEMGYIVEYDAISYIQNVDYHDDNGERRYLILQVTPDGANEQGVNVEDVVIILDENLNVISGSLKNGKSHLTPREFEIIKGEYPEKYDLYKYAFVDKSGKKLTLLFQTKKWDEEFFSDTSSTADRIFLLLIPLYLLAVGAFIKLLRRKIKKPLNRLDEAISGLARGEETRVGDCGGPWEIREIGESFDKLADRLAESEAQRKKLDMQRQKLIADISHDLKTPITVIAGYTNAIKDGKVPPDEMEKYLEAIDSKARDLTTLIDEFHEFSKVEHPMFALNSEEMDFCEYVRGYLAEKYDEIQLAGFCLEADIPESEAKVLIDCGQFKRALDNVLSNALRYNTLGTILGVRVRIDRARVRLYLTDNGIGIPEGMAQCIFEPFITGDDARSGKGSGLGLSITEHIITSHGGSVKLRIPPSKGWSTEFEITLPRIMTE